MFHVSTDHRSSVTQGTARADRRPATERRQRAHRPVRPCSVSPASDRPSRSTHTLQNSPAGWEEMVDEDGNIKKVQIYPNKSKAVNLAFDVTPAKYVTGLITEKGICDASTEGLKKLFK